MTVAQLIKALQKMPQDKIVTINNNSLYKDGDYEVTEVTDDPTEVTIGSDYEERI